MGRVELCHSRALHECHIILVRRHQAVGILLRCLFDELEQRHWLLLAVNHKRAPEYLVAAVLAVHLRESEHLAVRELTSELLGELTQIILLLLRERESLTLVVLGYVGYVLYGSSDCRSAEHS